MKKNLGWIVVAWWVFFTAGCTGGVQQTPRPVEPARQPAEKKPLVLPAKAQIWAPLIERLSNDGFDVQEMAALYSRGGVYYDPEPMSRKLRELLRVLYGADTIKGVQRGLASLGYTPGTPDGRAGTNTRNAIKAYQEAYGLEPDGEPSEELLAHITRVQALPPEQRATPKVTLTTKTQSDQVYSSVMKSQQLSESLEFMRTHAESLERMTGMYGVPGEIAVAIITVETRLGKQVGKNSAFLVLSGMALSRDFSVLEPYLGDLEMDADKREWLRQKALERGDWAYAELSGLLSYAGKNKLDPLGLPGSVYGAIGLCQFMPSNVSKFGADGNGDGIVNLFDVSDAVHSVGRYLRENGWKGDMSSTARKREVIYRYNKSGTYVNTVLAVAEYLRKAR